MCFQKSKETEDLIRLDSTSDEIIDDFDPLKSNNSSSQVPLSISNPLYTYENHKISENGIVPKPPPRPTSSRNDQDLLQEYGIDFNNFGSFQNRQAHVFDPFGTTPTSNKVSSQSQWTKFD